MINRGTTKNRLLKVLDILDKKDKSTLNSEVLIFIKDVDDVDYYFIDKEGNKIPTTQAIAEHSIKDSKGRLIKPHIVNIEVVDNSDLEKVLYEHNTSDAVGGN